MFKLTRATITLTIAGPLLMLAGPGRAQISVPYDFNLSGGSAADSPPLPDLPPPAPGVSPDIRAPGSAPAAVRPRVRSSHRAVRPRGDADTAKLRGQ